MMVSNVNRWLANFSGVSRPCATSLSSIGVVVALTRPVVIAMSLIHRSCSFSSTDFPCTPTLAALRQGHQVFLPVGVAAVDRVGGAKVQGLAKSVRVEVDGDDARRAVEVGGHHRRKAHRSSANDSHDVTWLD